VSNGTSIIKEIRLKKWFLASRLSRSLKIIGTAPAKGVLLGIGYRRLKSKKLESWGYRADKDV